MENTDNARIKTKNPSKTLVKADITAVNCFLDSPILKSDHSEYRLTDKDQFDLSIKIIENKIHLIANLEDEKLFKVSKQNFDYLFFQLISLFKADHSPIKMEQKNIGLISKQKSLWNQDHTIFTYLNKTLSESLNIISFTASFFKIESLKNFKSIHLFIHEKGSTQSKHVHIEPDGHVEEIQTIKEFSELFQAVKKSKNRSFGQSTLKAANFQIIGTCIGHEFSVLNYNLIFVISKNDFLPQEEKDITFFNKYKESFKIYFEHILNIEFNLKKSIEIFEILKMMPGFEKRFPADSQQIQSNQSFRSMMQTNFTEQLKDLRGNHFHLADINHQERIMLLGDLLNTLKHELSNPLFGLQLSTELLLTEKLSADQLEFIQHIHSNIARSQTIINNFTGLYRDKSEVKSVDIISLINEVFTLTKSESREIKKSIITGKDKINISTNPTYLSQILFNLIINSSQALKEFKTNDPNIEIKIEETLNSIILIISDNGPGIPSDKQKDIFEVFYTTKKAGTGLGLAISKRLAEKIDAKLSYLDSSIGANFKLELSK